MCINDWRAGRLVRSEVRAVDITAAPLTIPPNPNRVGISLAITAVVTFTECMSYTIGGTLAGAVNASDPRTHFTLAEHGDIPTKEFILTIVAGAVVAGVIEYFMPEDMVSAGLNEFTSHYAQRTGFIPR